MNQRAMVTVFCGLLGLAFSPTTASAQYEPPSHPLFDEDAVHTIRLVFHQHDWWDLLRANFEGVPDPEYLEAEFEWENFHFDSIGVRFKGRSSYALYPGYKKSFKLKFDSFVADQSIYGIEKLSLNNSHKDPAFVREKCYYELAADMGLPACRTNYAALYINGKYWGLYAIIEQVNKEFLQGRFGPDEDGNLWKGDPRGSFEYLGPNESAYHPFYELKTNESANDWSALVELVDALNNTPAATLGSTLHALTDINSAMAMVAMDALVLNLDGYSSRNHNHYAYHRDSDGRFVHFNWDANLAWGAFPDALLAPTLLRSNYAHPRLWLSSHPLTYRLWNQPGIENLFHSHIRRSISRGAEPSALLARMAELRDLVRPYAHADTNMIFTPEDFEEAMDREVSDATARMIPRLTHTVIRRSQELQDLLGPYLGREELALNELMASNGSTRSDGAGDFDDWVEVVNRGAQAVSLRRLFLSDDPTTPTAYAFPDVVLQPGDHFLVWADDEPLEGDDHAPFKLSAGGEALYLFDGRELLDTTTWGELEVDEAFGRYPEGDGPWVSDLVPTPEAPNLPLVGTGTLLINEFQAKNETGITDELGEHEDWIEIYNPTAADVDLAGHFLTDDLADPQQWQFPAFTISAGGHVIVWCDDDLGDGPLHANFKLGAAGEAIGLSGPSSGGSLLFDSYVYGPQTADFSEGRATDGAPDWAFFNEPTPGAANHPRLPRPLLYGIGKLSSMARVPLLASREDPSATAGSFAVTAKLASPNQLALLLHGPARARLPVSGGLRWIQGPIVRLPAQSTSATGSTTYAIPISPGMIGETRCYQLWFRDPLHADGTGVGLSNGLEVVFWP